ncbi:hypothetical protein NDU88_004821 [Pleurodeles waltl]|uniref:Uncharacterized protein n=1 Tax=Pleurodeles waltl TaxID=8319 RepID=A0AAV7WWL0_PLEWA|nr:hypothetical protein NDU88_004821 [Pleurodeles waltl]
MEEWGAAAQEDRTATTDRSQKEKRSRMAEQTSQHPRRRNANLPATLQEKRGNLWCVLRASKRAQAWLGGEKGMRAMGEWEVGKRREREPKGSGRTGREGNERQGGVGGREKKGKRKREKPSTEKV